VSSHDYQILEGLKNEPYQDKEVIQIKRFGWVCKTENGFILTQQLCSEKLKEHHKKVEAEKRAAAKAQKEAAKAERLAKDKI